MNDKKLAVVANNRGGHCVGGIASLCGLLLAGCAAPIYSDIPTISTGIAKATPSPVVSAVKSVMAAPIAPLPPTNSITLTASAAPPAVTPSFSTQPKRGSVTLSWNAPDDSSVVGYRIYYHSEDDPVIRSADAKDRLRATINGLDEGMLYYFECVSYDAAGIESKPSAQVQATTAVYIQRQDYISLIQSYGLYGRTNEIKMSTNLVDWWTVKTFVGNSLLQSYQHTNQDKAFFRVMSR